MKFERNDYKGIERYTYDKDELASAWEIRVFNGTEGLIIHSIYSSSTTKYYNFKIDSNGVIELEKQPTGYRSTDTYLGKFDGSGKMPIPMFVYQAVKEIMVIKN